jgi:type I restriction enzyme S subunit
MQSDVFMSRAVSISEGSLSPTIKWKVLAEQQFLLPSTSVQKEIALLMSKSLNVFEYFDLAILAAKKLKNRIALEIFNDDTAEIDSGKAKIDLVKLGHIAKFYNGRAYKLSEWENSGTPVIRLQNLTGTGDRFYYSKLELPEHQYCDKGDLLYMWSATFGPYIWESEKAIYHYHIWKIVCDERLVKKLFLYYLLEHKTEEWLRKSHGMGILHITKATMESIKIFLPSLSEQNRIINALQKLDETISLLKEKRKNQKQLLLSYYQNKLQIEE